MKLSQLSGKPTEREWLNVAIASAAPRIQSSGDENSVAAMLATAELLIAMAAHRSVGETFSVSELL